MLIVWLAIVFFVNTIIKINVIIVKMDMPLIQVTQHAKCAHKPIVKNVNLHPFQLVLNV